MGSPAAEDVGRAAASGRRNDGLPSVTAGRRPSGPAEHAPPAAAAAPPDVPAAPDPPGRGRDPPAAASPGRRGRHVHAAVAAHVHQPDAESHEPQPAGADERGGRRRRPAAAAAEPDAGPSADVANGGHAPPPGRRDADASPGALGRAHPVDGRRSRRQPLHTDAHEPVAIERHQFERRMRAASPELGGKYVSSWCHDDSRAKGESTNSETIYFPICSDECAFHVFHPVRLAEHVKRSPGETGAHEFGGNRFRCQGIPRPNRETLDCVRDGGEDAENNRNYIKCFVFIRPHGTRPHSRCRRSTRESLRASRNRSNGEWKIECVNHKGIRQMSLVVFSEIGWSDSSDTKSRAAEARRNR